MGSPFKFPNVNCFKNVFFCGTRNALFVMEKSSGKWFDRQVRVVPRRTVVGDIDRRFDNLSGSHHQSHVNCASSVYGIYVSGQFSRDVICCCTKIDYQPQGR